MKKLLSLILTIVMLVGIIPALPVSAETDGSYTYEVSDGEVTITDFDDSYEGALTIPSALGGYPVTAIGNNAFENCSSLTSVTVPNSVVTLGSEAFAGCEALESIDLPYYLTYIGADAFNGTALTRINLPGATTIIYAAAFRGCQDLTFVSISERVTEIREEAFADCPSLTDVGYSDTEYKWNMIDIQSGNDALLNATLHPIVIEYPQGPPESVAAPIVSPASCEFDDSIDVTLSCETPGANIYYTYSFPNQDIEVPAVMWLYEEPINFTYTTNLSAYAEKDGVMSEWVRATFTNRNEFSTEPPVTEGPTDEPTYPPQIYEIPAPRVSVESGVVPYGTVVRISPVDGHFSYYINGESYYSYDFYEDITIYEDTVLRVVSWKDVMDPNVTYISGEATYTYTVDPATIPSEAPTEAPHIGTYGPLTYEVVDEEVIITDCDTAFEYPIDIPSTLDGYPVTAIGEGAFQDCTDLPAVRLPDSITTIGRVAFADCWNLCEINLPDGITSIGQTAFASCYDLTSVTLPSGITQISNWTFWDCSDLTSVTIPDGVTSIGASAFAWTDLTSIDIPDSVTSIGEYAFELCPLKYIAIPDGVETIDSGTFYSCIDLEWVSIPDSVTTIDYQAFYYCTGLEDVYYGGTEAEWEGITINDYNDGIENATIHYDSTVLTHQVSGNFVYNVINGNAIITGLDSYLLSFNSIPDTLDGYPVTGIDDYAFIGMHLRSVTFPDSLTSIGDCAFFGCGLFSVTIPASVTFIGESAFSYNYTLSEIIVEEGNPSYLAEDNVLFNRDKTVLMQYAPVRPEAEEYRVPNSVTAIDPYAFAYARPLSRVSMPSVRSIGKAAFSFCENLTYVSLSDTITEIKEETFRQCINLEDIYIPRSVTSIKQDAFLACPSLAHITYTGDDVMWTHITIESGNDALERAELHPLISIPSEPPVTEEPTTPPTAPPVTEEPPESVAAPIISPAACEFDDSIDVTLSCETPGATIYYYLDFPNQDFEVPAVMLVYEEPIHLTYTTNLSAYAEKDGVMSEWVRATFTNRNELSTEPPVTEEPTAEPTDVPTAPPTDEPTADPTTPPTAEPTAEPTETPTEAPTEAPTTAPTEVPEGELTVSKSSVSVKVGKSVSVSAYLGDTDITDLATWNSKKDSIATVENGTITGVKAGTTKVSVSYGDQIKQIEVEVKTSGGGGGGGGGSSVRPTAAPTTVPTETPTQAPIQGTTPFSDVTETDWYFDAVSYAYENGLMNGVSENAFSPESTITRAMFVTVLYRMDGEKEVVGALPFTDVPQGSYYEKAVLWALQEGIVTGTSETTFSPDAEITREQMATMIYRYAQLHGQGFTGLWAFPLDFADSKDVSEYAYEALAWCTMNGIINGMDDNTLRPKENATRAQAATIFMRLENAL